MKVYVWKTPNGYKVPIFLEEVKAEYELVAVNLDKREQLQPEFVAMNPNHKIPVLDDEGFILFESGAILLYLAEKYKKCIPDDLQARFIAIQWLMFQMANVGPMFGQANHFKKHAPEPVPYAQKRYTDETRRLLAVLETRLSQVPYLAGEYGIADMATWPWVRSAQKNGHADIVGYPAVARWFAEIEEREAVKRALAAVDAACL